MSTVSYYAGTSGLVLPVPNKAYYPDEFKGQSRLCYYASLFNSIEVNSSFYKVPQAKTIAKWAGEVSDDFRFTFKLWREITHQKGLAFNPADVARFMQAIDAAGKKRGCLLVQFPPGTKSGLMPQLRELLNCVLQADPDRTWKIALEFRDRSWYNDHMFRLAQDYRLSVVIQDIPASATPMRFAGDEVVYLRFHGPGGKYRGSYPADVLEEYSSYIHEWQEEGKTVYTYFNNTMGDAVHNLATLNTFVQQT